MKLYRTINQEEYEQLKNTNSICDYASKNNRPSWIIFQDQEDNKRGKFFFSAKEDALLYARKTYSGEPSYILTIDVDKDIRKYIGTALYTFDDYNSLRQYVKDMSHSFIEFLLPFEMVDEALNKPYKVENAKGFSKVKNPVNKTRDISYKKLATIMREILDILELIDLYKWSLSSKYATKDTQAKIDAKVKEYENLLSQFNEAYDKYLSYLNSKEEQPGNV